MDGPNTKKTVRVVLGTVFAQGLVLGLGFLAGILVVRFLPPLEYAAYTVITASVGAQIAIADAGLGNAMISRGGQTLLQPDKLGAVFNAGFAVRRRALFWLTPIGVLVTASALFRLGFDVLPSLAIALTTAPQLFLSTLTVVLETVPRLRQNVVALQRLQLSFNSLRLLITALALWVSKFAFAAVLASALAQWWYCIRLRTLAEKDLNRGVPRDHQLENELTRQVRQTLPFAIYFAISGQLSLWLVSLFGAATAVASVGALGRLAVILVSISAAFSILAVPRFARFARDDKNIVLKFWQYQSALLVICVGLTALTALFGNQVLTVLGPHYSNLRFEAVLTVASGGVWALSSAAMNLASSRSIVTPYYLMVPALLFIEFISIVSLPVSTIRGAIFLSMITAGGHWALHSIYFTFRAGHPRVTG